MTRKRKQRFPCSVAACDKQDMTCRHMALLVEAIDHKEAEQVVYEIAKKILPTNRFTNIHVDVGKVNPVTVKDF